MSRAIAQIAADRCHRRAAGRGAARFFDLSFYAVLADRLERDFDNDLRVSAAEIASALTPDRHERLDADDVRPGVLEPMSVDDASRPGVYVQILNGAGHIVATSGTRLPIDRSRIRRVLTGLEDLDWVGRDERLRLLSRPVVGANGSVIGVIQVAQSARFLDSSLAAVRMLVLVGTTLTLLGSVVAAWLMVGHALRPIGKLTAAANHIVTTGRLDARIAPSGTADEVGALVQSFNLMVEQLDGAFERQQQLLADTSHELRNPLTAIRANLEIIESMDGPDEVYEAAAEAKDETIRMQPSRQRSAVARPERHVRCHRTEAGRSGGTRGADRRAGAAGVSGASRYDASEVIQSR